MLAMYTCACNQQMKGLQLNNQRDKASGKDDKSPTPSTLQGNTACLSLFKLIIERL